MERKRCQTKDQPWYTYEYTQQHLMLESIFTCQFRFPCIVNGIPWQNLYLSHPNTLQYLASICYLLQFRPVEYNEYNVRVIFNQVII